MHGLPLLHPIMQVRDCTMVWGLQESVSWAIGFGIPAVAMALAVIIFMAGSPRYTHVEPTER